jgi:hypothetical protein
MKFLLECNVFDEDDSEIIDWSELYLSLFVNIMKVTKQISLTRFLKPKIEDDINREFEKIMLDLEM